MSSFLCYLHQCNWKFTQQSWFRWRWGRFVFLCLARWWCCYWFRFCEELCMSTEHIQTMLLVPIHNLNLSRTRTSLPEMSAPYNTVIYYELIRWGRVDHHNLPIRIELKLPLLFVLKLNISSEFDSYELSFVQSQRFA